MRGLEIADVKRASGQNIHCSAGPCLARVCGPELACVLRACTKHTTRAWLEEPASAEQPEWSNDLNWPWVTLRSTGWAWLRLGYRHQLQLTQGHTRHTGHLVTAGAADGGDPEDGGGVGTERGGRWYHVSAPLSFLHYQQPVL